MLVILFKTTLAANKHCQTLSNFYLPLAIEGTFPNVHDRVGDRYTFQRTATKKGIVPSSRHRVRDSHISKDLQTRKELAPIDVTEGGIVMFSKELHNSKALSPITVTESAKKCTLERNCPQ